MAATGAAQFREVGQDLLDLFARLAVAEDLDPVFRLAGRQMSRGHVHLQAPDRVGSVLVGGPGEVPGANLGQTFQRPIVVCAVGGLTYQVLACIQLMLPVYIALRLQGVQLGQRMTAVRFRDPQGALLA